MPLSAGDSLEQPHVWVLLNVSELFLLSNVSELLPAITRRELALQPDQHCAKTPEQGTLCL